MFMINPFFNQQESYNPSLCFGLYHFDGPIGWTLFSDNSPANRTLTGDGALLWDTAKFGDSSVTIERPIPMIEAFITLVMM